MSGPAALLTAVVFLPLLGAVVLALLPARSPTPLKAAAIGITLADFAAAIALWWGFDPATSSMQATAVLSWVPELGIAYRIGVDGISLPLVLLTSFLMPLTLIGAWKTTSERPKAFLLSMLLLETGMLGAFVALDLFLFYVFWEAMLIPMYFLIGVWGGQRRVYAALKFFVFTMAGSLVMLVAIIYVANLPGGGWDFSLSQATRRVFDPAEEGWLFWAFALAFAIKVPMFPVHTCLPDAHVEAPTPGSVILAGVLLKLGIDGRGRKHGKRKAHEAVD
ncbi:MAG: NADH-quinone oxidoreductase subunit M, partial [Myxococcota bacterium]